MFSSLFNFTSSTCVPVSPLIHGIEFVCLLMLLTFLRIPAGKSAALTKEVPWYDYGLGLLSLVPLVYALSITAPSLNGRASPHRSMSWSERL